MRRTPHKRKHPRAKKRNKIIKHLRRARKNRRMVGDHLFYREWRPTHH